MHDKEYLVVGKILSSWGIKGQIKVEPLTDDPKRFTKLKEVFIEFADETVSYRVLSVLFINQYFPVLKLEGINSVEEANKLRRCYIKIYRKDAVKLPKNRYFICDIIGLCVFDEQGGSIGTIVDVFQTGANDVYVIKNKDKTEILIPAIKEVIKEIDIKNGYMTIRLLEGMI